VLPSQFVFSPSSTGHQLTIKEKKFFYKLVLFVIAYGNITASISLFPCASNNMKNFTGLGELCGHESRGGNVHGLR
jgi:hypothetical protein